MVDVRIGIIIFFVFCSSLLFGQEYGLFVDERDGRTYRTIQILDQVWMAENLAYLPEVSSISNSLFATPCYYIYGYINTDLEEAKQTENYARYGVLYNWPAAVNACPEGWHLPTDSEWKLLEMALGMTPEDADKVKSRGLGIGSKMKNKTCWYNYGNGNNKSGFTAVPAGYRDSYGSYNIMGEDAYFWSDTEETGSNAWCRHLTCHTSKVFRSNFPKQYGFSIRCVQD